MDQVLDQTRIILGGQHTTAIDHSLFISALQQLLKR